MKIKRYGEIHIVFFVRKIVQRIWKNLDFIGDLAV